MADGTRAFNARCLSTWTSDRLYRIYVTGEQLVFVRIGGQGGTGVVIAAQFGLIGLLWHWLFSRKSDAKRRSLLEELDSQPPEHLIARHKHNFSATPADLVETSIEPPSALATHGKQYGTWRIALRDKKPMTLQFEDPDEMRVAVELLVAFFGAQLQINLEWDPEKKKYIKKKT
jgi:hypothetical protein